MIAGGAFMLAAGNVFAGLYGDTPDAKHAWAVHDWNRPKPHKVMPAEQQGNPPSDAVVLFDGTKDSLEKNWSDAGTSRVGPQWCCMGSRIQTSRRYAF